ncbi:hypothetical protein ISU02_18275 [Fusibacter sp. Q10-2]|uniref:Citrate transporter-like domain-containing protein n=1 Tax=Fusibacter ferrireducens TaxID=2785058 RepID=A0ABR9ZX68_9FIRM|nr:hypothetical protein [Fusibacter ferrireducens]
MTTWDHAYRVISIAFAILYLINCFVNNPILSYITCILLILILCKSIPTLPKTSLLSVGGLLGIGMALLWGANAPLQIWIKAITQSANLVTLFICTPMISIPFYYDRYQDELVSIVKSRISNPITFCALVFFCTHILGVILSIGAITIIYDLMIPLARLYKAEDAFLGTVLCAYCASGFWSPAWASMLTVTTATHIPWIQLIPIGIVFSLIYAAIALALLALKSRSKSHVFHPLVLDKTLIVDWKKIRIMLTLTVSLILSIILMNLFTDWNLLMIISIIAVLFPIACALIQRYAKAYKQGMKTYYKVSLNRIHGQVSMFTAAGFLGIALQNYGINDLVKTLTPHWLTAYPIWMCMAIILAIILPSLIGIHAVVTGTAIATIIVPSAIGLSVFTFALTVITGWLLAIMLSPFSATSLLGANYSGKTSFEVSLGLNGIFGFIIVLVFSVLIGTLNTCFSIF